MNRQRLAKSKDRRDQNTLAANRPLFFPSGTFEHSRQAFFRPPGNGSKRVGRSGTNTVGGELPAHTLQTKPQELQSGTVFVLGLPPVFCQGESFVCWAAAAASWLNATAILPGVTTDDLIIRFGQCICGDGSLPEPYVARVYSELGIHLSNVTSFDYDFLKENLKKHGHLILILDTGSVKHAVVAYGVGVNGDGEPDGDFYSIFDPIDCKYKNVRFGDYNVLAVGRRGEPGSKADCSDTAKECGET